MALEKIEAKRAEYVARVRTRSCGHFTQSEMERSADHRRGQHRGFRLMRENGNELLASSPGNRQFQMAFGRFVVSPAFLLASLLVFYLVPERLVRRRERQTLVRSARRVASLSQLTTRLGRWKGRPAGKSSKSPSESVSSLSSSEETGESFAEDVLHWREAGKN
jgi:hypothetical protein